MTTTATFTATRTSAGSKTHRAYISQGLTMILCGAQSNGTNRGSAARIFEIEIGTTPENACSKCFPGVAVAKRSATPKRSAAPAVAKIAAARITLAEAFEMIEAAGHADKVGGRDRFCLGDEDETTDLDGILAAIAGWNA